MRDLLDLLKTPLVIFVVSLLVSFILGTIATLILFKSLKSSATVRTRRIALSGGAAFFIIALSLICYYFLPILQQKSLNVPLLPTVTPKGYTAFSQQDFAIALPNYVNQNYIISNKMYHLAAFEGDMNAPSEEFNPEESGMIMISVIQVPEESDLDLDSFSREARGSVEQNLTSVSNDPNFRVEMFDEGFSSFLGHNAKTQLLRMHVTEKSTGKIKQIDLKIISFADEKNLKLYSIGYIPSEKTEKIVSTLNVG